MNIVFRSDASLDIGKGHIMRCLSLAKGLRSAGSNVEFICRQHEGSLIEYIESNGFRVHKLPLLQAKNTQADSNIAYGHWLGVSQLEDAHDCINILRERNTNLLIIDHYAIDKEWHRKLVKFCDKIMVIDDLMDKSYQCDIVLNQTFNIDDSVYESLTPKDCQMLLGSEYALLRPEFSKWRKYSIKRRSNLDIGQIFINMGGIDIDNNTKGILKELEKCKFRNNLKAVVVLGKDSPHINSVVTIARSLSYNVEVKIGVNNMAEIMADSDLAIGASGSTTWERCCLGLPTIQIVTADNQRTIAKLLAKKGAIRFCESVTQVVNFVDNFSDWAPNASLTAQQVVDGLGVERVVSKVMT